MLTVSSVVNWVFCIVLWHRATLCYCFSSVYCTVHFSCVVLCLWCTCCCPNWGFSVLFPLLWGKWQDTTCKDGARPALTKLFLHFLLLCVFLIFFIVMYVPFSVFCVLSVCKCVLYYCHRVVTQLQLNIYHIILSHISCCIIYHVMSYYIIYHISYHIYRIIYSCISC
jgi:hypothetical protein